MTNKQINKFTVGVKLIGYWIIGLLVVLVVLVVFSTEAEASSVSLSVNPPILQITAKPPAKITAPIKIKNLGEETVELQILLKPFTAAKSEDGKVQYLPQTRSFDEEFPILSKIRLFEENTSIDSLTLAPEQEKELTLYIEVDKSESLGDYYFSLVFLSQSNPPEGNVSGSSAGISTNVLLSIGPKGQPAAEISKFSAPKYLQEGPVPFTVKITNTGKQFLTPKGYIIIKNMFGQRIGKVDLMPVNILAETTRQIPDEQTATEKLKRSTISNQPSDINKPTALWREKFLLGLYTANLTMGVTEEGPVLNKKIYFFAFPAYGIILVIAVLLGLFVIYKKIKRKLKNP
ncbi:hypothetical protein KKG52_01125 [Patescibacteria group bacterium]|nr:hypothetical protein [Patescibacteria group bacterium]